MNRTKIEWAKNPDGSLGYTFNPITGCLNHVNGLCKGGGFPCYAHKLANGRLRGRYLANPHITNQPRDMNDPAWDRIVFDPFYPRFWPEKLKEIERPLHPFMAKGTVCDPHYRRKRKGIFVCDMSDLFGIGVLEEWTRQTLDAIRRNDHDRFYLLTKQPQNLVRWSPFPDNCWVGVTVTGLTEYPLLDFVNVQARVKYVSFEPLLSSVAEHLHLLRNIGIDLVIIGAQTKPYNPPKIEWVQEIETSARQAGIAIFEKDNLKPLLFRELIQEMP